MRAGVLGSEANRRERRKFSDLHQLRAVDMLVGEARANNVIRGRHDLNAQASLVGVNLARRNVGRFSCTQRHGIHEECQDDSRVTAVRGLELTHQLVRTKRRRFSRFEAAPAGGDKLFHQRRRHW